MHFLSLLRGAIWYYNAIYILFTYFASFIGYEDDILEVISNLHVQGAKFGGNKENLAEIFLKVELRWAHGLCFFKVWCIWMNPGCTELW